MNLLLASACVGPPPEGHVDVVLAASELPAGKVLEETDLWMVRTPEDYVAPGQAVRGDGLLGRRLAEPTLAHQALRTERLIPSTEGDPFPAPSWLDDSSLMVPAPNDDVVMVIVAARELPVGLTITEDDLYAIQIPPAYVPSGVFLSPEYVVGRKVCGSRVLVHELVRTERLCRGPATR